MNRRNALRGFIAMVICLAVTFAVCARTEVYFTHVDDIQSIILLKINNAEDFIDVAMYMFTDFVLASALVEARERGIEIRIYLDRSQVTARYTQSKYLVQNAVDIRISSNNYIMHNKFAIIDGELLITGSYNWTQSANTRNDENLTIIDCIYVIEAYQEQFEKLWSQFSLVLFEKLLERAND